MGVWRNGVNRWLDMPGKPEGMNKRSARFFREYKALEKMFSRNLIILYFLITRLDMKECYQMFVSSRKQKQFIIAVKLNLKKYAVEEKWEKDFERDVANHKRRCQHVLRIIQENIRMTSLYPYFQTVGFERLNDFSVKYAEGEDDAATQLEQEIQEWNEEHSRAIEAYMASIKEERANMEAHRAKVKADEKAEKEAIRAEKKARTAEEREIRQNKEKHRKEQMKIEREFERYYK